MHPFVVLVVEYLDLVESTDSQNIFIISLVVINCDGSAMNGVAVRSSKGAMANSSPITCKGLLVHFWGHEISSYNQKFFVDIAISTISSAGENTCASRRGDWASSRAVIHPVDAIVLKDLKSTFLKGTMTRHTSNGSIVVEGYACSKVFFGFRRLCD